MKLLCNGIEKETKYSNGWLDSHGRQRVYEDMETNHLLNVYHHIGNNINNYIKIGYLQQDMVNTRTEIKSELLSRGVTDSQIENHVEETWKMGPNPYIVR